MQIIGLVGATASGKDKVAQVLETRGFVHLRMSDILRKLNEEENQQREKGGESIRETLTELGNRLRKERGPGVVAELAVAEIKKRGLTKVAVEGIRNPKEIEVLKEFFGNTKIVAVEAKKEIRLRRFIERALKDRKEDQASEEGFNRVEAIENSTDESGQNIPACVELADYSILNEGMGHEGLIQLEGMVDELVETLYPNSPEGQSGSNSAETKSARAAGSKER